MSQAWRLPGEPTYPTIMQMGISTEWKEDSWRNRTFNWRKNPRPCCWRGRKRKFFCGGSILPSYFTQTAFCQVPYHHPQDLQAATVSPRYAVYLLLPVMPPNTELLPVVPYYLTTFFRQCPSVVYTFVETPFRCSSVTLLCIVSSMPAHRFVVWFLTPVLPQDPFWVYYR